MSSNQETGIGEQWHEEVKALAKAEKELGVSRWCEVTLEMKRNGEYVRLHKYDLPAELHERWAWVIRWRKAKLQCQYPRESVYAAYCYYYRHNGKCVGWQNDIKQLIACKSRITKARKNIDSYLKSQQGNLFFNPAEDEQLIKVQAKLKRAEESALAAEERMRIKLTEYKSQLTIKNND